MLATSCHPCRNKVAARSDPVVCREAGGLPEFLVGGFALGIGAGNSEHHITHAVEYCGREGTPWNAALRVGGYTRRERLGPGYWTSCNNDAYDKNTVSSDTRCVAVERESVVQVRDESAARLPELLTIMHSSLYPSGEKPRWETPSASWTCRRRRSRPGKVVCSFSAEAAGELIVDGTVLGS